MRLAVLLALFLVGPALAQEESFREPEILVSSDLAALPPAVAEMREKLIAAAHTGEIEALRPIIEAQEVPPTLSFGSVDDPIEYLLLESTTGDGVDVLATLLNVLDAPYAVFDASGDRPSYVWPYLAFSEDLTKLSKSERVDAYRILGADFESYIELEGWYYWRVYIGPEGEWEAFVAGD